MGRATLPTPTGKVAQQRGLKRFFFSARFGEASPALLVLSYLVVGMNLIVAIMPFFYIITTALKESKFLFSYPPKWLPIPLYWENFVHMLVNTHFLRWTANTLFVAVVVTALKLLFDSMAGYAFAKMTFPGKDILFIFVIATLMIPFSAILIPLFFLVRGLGIINTYWALILPPLANPIGIFLMRSFIENLPNDLENAARLDGASEFQIYTNIILPLIKPALVVLGILVFNGRYQSFVWPLVAAPSIKMYTLTVGVAMQRGITTIDYGLFSASSVLALIPIILVFLLFQKQWIAGSLAGALKQ